MLLDNLNHFFSYLLCFAYFSIFYKVDEEDNMHSKDNMDPSFDKQAILRELGSAKQSGLPQSELEPVAEEP